MKNKGKAMRNMLFGMLGAAICMAAMWLSSACGKDNDRNGMIMTNWPKMPMIRFEISIILISLGVPLFYLGAKEMVKAMRLSRRRRSINDLRMAKMFDMCMHLSVIGLPLVQGVFTAIAITYKLLFNTKLMGADIISIVESLFYYFAIPVFAYLVFSLAGTSISFMYFIINDRVKVSKICILFNPLIMFGIGELLKLTKLYYLVDFAAAMIPFGYMLMLAAGMVHVAKMPAARRRREM
ncbi:hypothetical protein SAMN06297422_103138 [Lachnospiraceae bacterium]|nr:hypothetical protein SAMN06297422_103138 [Lachnospiraceae bacterium]